MVHTSLLDPILDPFIAPLTSLSLPSTGMAEPGSGTDSLESLGSGSGLTLILLGGMLYKKNSKGFN